MQKAIIKLQYLNYLKKHRISFFYFVKMIKRKDKCIIHRKSFSQNLYFQYLRFLNIDYKDYIDQCVDFLNTYYCVVVKLLSDLCMEKFVRGIFYARR